MIAFVNSRMTSLEEVFESLRTTGVQLVAGGKLTFASKELATKTNYSVPFVLRNRVFRASLKPLDDMMC